MQAYLDLLQDIRTNGIDKGDRTGTGTRSVFGRQLRFDLAAGFPILTTKKVHFKSVVNELIWFLSGDTNTQWLRENGVSIWDEWATEAGELGPVYGAQWRRWPTRDGEAIDQIAYVLDCLKNRPDSRRILFHGWNVEYLPDETQSPQENVVAGRIRYLLATFSTSFTLPTERCRHCFLFAQATPSSVCHSISPRLHY